MADWTSVVERLDQFNARDLNASQVADRFVEPLVFEGLAAAGNTLVVGPRGSGKTTLLRMLTAEGFERSRISGTTSVPSLNFGSVYVPIDVQLSDRLDALADAGFESALTDQMIRSLYAWHVFRCVAEALSWHCSSSRRHSQEKLLKLHEEAALVRTLADLWGVDVDVPVVRSLKSSLRARQARALEGYDLQAMTLMTGSPVDVKSLLVTDLDVGLKGAIEAICEYGESTGIDRWAILFDEVEVAPDSLQRTLLSYLRFSDTQTLFKVAISPYMQSFRGLPDRSRGSALNDYNVIDLQALDDDDMYHFTNAYIAKSSELSGRRFESIFDMLGESLLAVRPGVGVEYSYRPSSRQAKRMGRLAGKDPSFARYLSSRGLNVDDLISDLPSDERAPFRKTRQVALVREEYLSNHASTRRRTKSNVSQGQLYVGAAGISRLCEGNPRRLAFMSSMLLLSQNEDGRVSYSAQVAAMVRTQAAFRSFLRGLPVSDALGSVLPRGLLSLLDLLGHYFHNSILAEDFDTDPVGSFIVDSNASDDVEELISRAVNSGAIVQLADAEEARVHRTQPSFDPLTSSRGKRFRLSYLLAPGYGLTLRVGRANSLRGILNRSRDSDSKRDQLTSRALLSGQQGLW